jgi:UDP-N-acetyl-D-glucosamine/UDP-N-acetyl-D-galactosamine dehydrogenase
VARETVKLLIGNGVNVKGAKVLVLGVTFKENVPDTRNTRVVDLVRELESFGCDVTCHDPIAGDAVIRGLRLRPATNEDSGMHAVVLAVPHQTILRELGTWTRGLKRAGVLVDVKDTLTPDQATWRL